MCHLKSRVQLMSPSGDAVSGVKASENLSCAVEVVPVRGDMTDMEVLCGSAAGTVADKLRLLATEDYLELRIFADATFLEVYFQKGRTVMTVPYAPPITSELFISADQETAVNVSTYSMKSIWAPWQVFSGRSRVKRR